MQASDIVAETGLGENFIVNAVDAQLIEFLYNRHGASWVEREETRKLLIPRRFGMMRLSGGR